MNTQNLKNIYNNNFPMHYSIAWQICHLKNKTEQLLTNFAEKIYNQHTDQHMDSIFSIKQFKNTLLLNQLICNQITIQDYCNMHKKTDTMFTCIL